MNRIGRDICRERRGTRRSNGNARSAVAVGGDRGAIGPRSRAHVRKSPIENKSVLCEAYDYPKKVSFSRGMRVELGDCVMLYISGTASVNEHGDSIHPGDVKAQTERTFANIKALLESECADWHDVVRTTCYLADFRTYDEFNEVRNAFYQNEGLDPLPASTCIEARICRPELLVEVEAIAIIPRDRAT
jgi:2-iminobutanoate/2-iminopropanoate deaminase